MELDRIQLEFTPKALRAVAELAIERHTGARGLRSIMEGVLMDTMYEVPTMENVEKIVVTENAVKGKERPRLEFAAKELPAQTETQESPKPKAHKVTPKADPQAV
jgi:ATP-dependent Clp protease ATP-binding subunit ClpX